MGGEKGIDYRRKGKETIKKILKRQNIYQIPRGYKEKIWDVIKETGDYASFSSVFESIKDMFKKYKCYWFYQNSDGDSCQLLIFLFEERWEKVIVYENITKGIVKRLNLENEQFKYYEQCSAENKDSYDGKPVSYKKVEKDIIPFFESQLKVMGEYCESQKDGKL